MRIACTVLVLLWTLSAVTGCVITGEGGGGVTIPVGLPGTGYDPFRVAAVESSQQGNKAPAAVLVAVEEHP